MTNWPSSAAGAVLIPERAFFANPHKVRTMSDREKTISDELLLKVSKEIAVKFIEVGRLTPATFESSFEKIYNSIKKTVEKP